MAGVKVCWFSTGISSFVACYLSKNIDEIIYTHVPNQHPDSLRFLHDCEKLLGRKITILQWEAQNFDHHTYVWGYDLNEKRRADRLINTMTDYDHEFPLIENGFTKEDCHALAKELGLKRPVMYDLGYPNNNCIGCVKGGMGYWNKIRVDFPDVFERRARQEREIGHSCIKGVFLDELDPKRGCMDLEVMEDCGIACQLVLKDREELKC